MECVVWLFARYITLAGSEQCGVCCLVVCEIHHLGGQPTVWSVLFGCLRDTSPWRAANSVECVVWLFARYITLAGSQQCGVCCLVVSEIHHLGGQRTVWSVLFGCLRDTSPWRAANSVECVVWLLARYITLAGSEQCGVCCLVVCEIHHLGGQRTVWSVLFGCLRDTSPWRAANSVECVVWLFARYITLAGSEQCGVCCLVVCEIHHLGGQRKVWSVLFARYITLAGSEQCGVCCLVVCEIHHLGGQRTVWSVLFGCLRDTSPWRAANSVECVVWLLARYITLAGSQQCGVCCLVVSEIHHLGGQPTVWSVLFGC